MLGVIIAFLLYRYTDGMLQVLVPFAAGTFIYIAWSDLIPELHKENTLAHSIPQILFLILWIGIMSLLLLIG